MSKTDAFVFVRKRRFEWFSYPTEAGEDDTFEPDPDFAGFRVRIYANATMEEVRHEAKWWQQLTDKDVEEVDYFAEFGWRISEWNYTAETADGEIAPVPPPADDPRSMWLLPPMVMYWLLGKMRTAHFPKAREVTPPTPLASVGTTATKTRKKTSPDATPLAS